MLAGILIVVILIAGDVVLHRVGPILKARVIATLSRRFDSRVELDRFQVSAVRGFEISGDGLRLYPNHLSMTEPLIQVDHFSFHLLSWRQLMQTPNYIGKVRVSGLVIHVPSKSQRAQLKPLTSASQPVPRPSHSAPQLTVGEILIDRASVVFENNQPGKVPLTFVIHKLTLRSVAAGQPMKFQATLVNPKPLGNIYTSGDFGPFDAHSPGDTPVDGQYSFTHADLSTIRGIGGTLSSTGRYSGQLNRIAVDGETTTPDFRLTTADHPMPLKTTFHAIVDGTSGDTQLQPVDAWLAQTHIVASGDVAHVPGVRGRNISLNIVVGPGRIQDLLELTGKGEPMMSGQVQAQAQMQLPPGDASIPDRLDIHGAFTLDGIHFANPKIQGKVDELSLRGQGQAQQADQEADALKAGNLKAATAANVASQMQGTFTFANGKISLPALDYEVPGAEVKLSGVYTLHGEALDFNGVARLHAHVSQMVTGWKSALLKAVNPFFAKNGAGTQVPIRITGTRSDPRIGLAFH